MNLGSLLLGPLAGPECRRALGRGWLIVVRALAGAAVLLPALVMIWWWWLSQLTDPGHLPYVELRVGLSVVLGMLVVIALLLGPAVTAGTLAGEKERGALGLLLTTRVNSREIVTGRFAGKLSQVGMILLAGVPALALLGSLSGHSVGLLALAALLPAGVAFGGGGLGVMASALSRRSRDALLSVYLIDLLFLLAPMSRFLRVPQGFVEVFATLNPFVGIDALVRAEDAGPVLFTCGLWVALGFLGMAVASWRLRPAALGTVAVKRRPVSRGRFGWVPPVNERRPMVWKELFIERVGNLGRFGQWVGWLLVLGLGGGSVFLTAVIGWEEVVRPERGLSLDARDLFARWVNETGTLLCCLIQWGIGLRAGVAISSERERGTWDSLMTSPLEGRAIVVGKVWGSVYALRWVIAAAFLAWWLAVASGVLAVSLALNWTTQCLVIGSFMAAVGVRTSLACQTATRAMSVTIGLWLGAFVATSFMALVIIATLFMILNAGLLATNQLGLAPAAGGVWAPVPMYVAWPLTTECLYAIAAVLIMADTQLRFDRLAGRITGGPLAVALDRILHGGNPADEENEGVPAEHPQADPIAESA